MGNLIDGNYLMIPAFKLTSKIFSFTTLPYFSANT